MSAITPPTGVPPKPGAPPPGSPPMGTAPGTQVTPNRGSEIAAAQGAGLVIKLMGDLIPKAGAATDFGLALAKAIQSLAKFVPQGASNPNAEQQQMKDLMTRQKQMTQLPPGGSPAPGTPPV